MGFELDPKVTCSLYVELTERIRYYICTLFIEYLMTLQSDSIKIISRSLPESEL